MFLETNPIGSVFDADEDKTKFKTVKLSDHNVLEFDERCEERLIAEFKEDFKRVSGSDRLTLIGRFMTCMPVRARLTSNLDSFIGTWITEGKRLVRVTGIRDGDY